MVNTNNDHVAPHYTPVSRMVNTTITDERIPGMTTSAAVSNGKNYYVAAVDVGTTHIRCQIIDTDAKVCGFAQRKVELLYPHPGRVEIDPDELWDSFVHVVSNAIKDAAITAHQVACLGIATQRATFTTWNRHNGKPYHNFITWKDMRACSLAQAWNKSWRMMALRTAARLLHAVTGQKRFLAASVLVFHTRQVLLRLMWALEHIPELRQSAKEGDVAFGMIETWLLWKLTSGKVHASDYSCASATAMFDPFMMEWGDWAFRLFDIPSSILPELKDTSSNFGSSDADIFGASIPITCLIGDQQAAMFGEGCVERGDMKCTMGTGSFLDINTGNTAHASVGGLYPLIGWKLGSEVVYIAEGISNDTGTAINWLQNIGLLENPSKCNDIANAVESSEGVHFVPAFSGLQAPLNDNNACAGFLGISPSTRREHMIRAVLEALAFRVKQLFDVMQSEADFDLTHFRADGGVANCDFVMQLVADLTGRTVVRSEQTEMACLGAAFFAGLARGVWKCQEDFHALRKSSQSFHPSGKTVPHFKDWERAVERCVNWYINAY